VTEVEALLAAGADINKLDRAQFNPFMDAINSGQVDCARWLLRQDGIKLQPEIWSFCRERGLESVLTEARYGERSMAVPKDPLRLLPEDAPPVDPDETVLF